MRDGQFVLSVLVNNQFGVLTRISSLFSRRGFNIDSLTVGETEDPAFSRMTIQTTWDECTKNQIVRQLEKLHDVQKVQVMKPSETVIRELVLVKIKVGGKLSELTEAANVFRATVVDLTAETMSIQITGESTKIDGFLDYVKGYGILEICRTGVTAIGRGSETF